MSILYPTISDDQGVIYPEYLDSYNRRLSREDIQELITLLEQKDYQACVDKGSVRKIIFDDRALLQKFCNSLLQTDDPTLTKYFFKKISYDELLEGIISLPPPPPNSTMHRIIMNTCNKYLENGDYTEEITQFLTKV